MQYLPDDALLLPRLLVGLEALYEQSQNGKFYPYPTTLCIAWNALSIRLIAEGKVTAPISLNGLLALCERPVGDWFPAPLPAYFPLEGCLLCSGGIELTDTASAFLTEGVYRQDGVRRMADAAGIERALQNNQFAELLDRLRKAVNREKAQNEYVFLRRFLITNPFADTGEIRAAFAQTSIKPSDVGAFYSDCKPNESYYNCPTCGPLRREGGRWRGAKPDVCSSHLGEDLTSLAVSYRHDLRHLCTAIHERVCLHGIEEVRWLDAAHALRKIKSKAANALTDVEDWPGIDTYDLRLTFKDGTVWAADMKDHRDPDALGKSLDPIPAGTEALRYDRAFYVIPDRRETRKRGYCRRVQRGVELPPNHQILTATAFEEAVDAHLSRRKSKENTHEPKNAL